MVSIEEFLSFVYYKKSVQVNENQSIATKKFKPIQYSVKKSHHKLLRSREDPTRHQGLSKWYHQGNIKIYWGEVQKCTRHFPWSEINYVIYFGEVENPNLFNLGMVLQAIFLPGKTPGLIQPGLIDSDKMLFRSKMWNAIYFNIIFSNILK